ncbi:MAG: LuxR C-terminal-related transcriptional regulator [Dehalococcoidia bacterium]
MEAPRVVEPLTKRQREVLDLIGRGRTNYEIAQALGISLDGAKWHVREVLARLGVESREQAAERWRHERSWLSRTRGAFVGLLHMAPVRLALAGAAASALAVAVTGVIFVTRDDDAPANIIDAPTEAPALTPTPSPTPVDDLAPDTGNAMANRVIEVLQAGDIPALKQLLVETPEACATGARTSFSPVPCPAGEPDGTLIPTFRVRSGLDRYLPGEQTDALLATVVPGLERFHAVIRSQPDRFNDFIPPSNYEVVMIGYNAGPGINMAIYFVDDRGVVGIAVDNLLVLNDRLSKIDPADWVIAPITEAKLETDNDFYVLGRDSEIRFTVTLPASCEGRPFAVRLYGLPDPGVGGGIQAMIEPGLMSEARSVVPSGGMRTVAFNLPATASTPMFVRPGLLSSCLSEIAVQGHLQLALTAPPEDADIAIIEYLGQALDLNRGDGRGTVGEFLTPFVATVDGTVCETLDSADRSLRNVRGNLVFRIGTSGQPPQCAAPGQQIVFHFPTGIGGSLEGKPLFEKPTFVPGVIQLVRNIVPEPIVN